jgi:hypothetical protein
MLWAILFNKIKPFTYAHSASLVLNQYFFNYRYIFYLYFK